MITRIELTNFMAHRHTVIEPAAGLTVLVGPNNVGKSAVVAALQVLCQNESAAYVMRHGERECSVQVETDDGHSAVWRRKNSTQSYVVDGQVFDRLKGRIPDELHRALRLPMVDAESDADFDVHFGTQKSPIFLLNSPATNRARFFASSSDAIQLVAMQKRHKEKLSERQKEKTRLETESRKLNEELEVLKPVSEIDEQVASAACVYEELLRFESWLDQAQRHGDSLEKQIEGVLQQSCRAAALSELSAPPILVDIGPLNRMIEEVVTAEHALEKGTSRAAALRGLATPPELMKTEPLSELIASLEQAESQLASAVSRTEALAGLSCPPHLEEVQSLSELSQELSNLNESIGQLQQEQQALSHLVSPPPTLSDESSLATLNAAMAKTSSQHHRWQAESSYLVRLISPPAPVDLESLAKVVYNFDKLAEEVRLCGSHAVAAEEEMRRTGEELRMRSEGTECPICGNLLDADAVVARAAVGLGGHAHA